jgi:hypothetical protein
VPKSVPPLVAKWCDLVRSGDGRNWRDCGRIYEANSLHVSRWKSNPPQLLTGGLLVRIQPEEPISLIFERLTSGRFMRTVPRAAGGSLARPPLKPANFPRFTRTQLPAGKKVALSLPLDRIEIRLDGPSARSTFCTQRTFDAGGREIAPEIRNGSDLLKPRVRCAGRRDAVGAVLAHACHSPTAAAVRSENVVVDAIVAETSAARPLLDTYGRSAGC